MKFFKKLKKLGGEIMDQFTPEDNRKLRKWKTKLESSITNYNTSIMDEREQIYLGTRQVDGNVNSRQAPTKKANNIYNVVFEMIESQVNSTIPQPAVKSKRAGFEEQARMVEDSISNDLKEIGIEEINDINERITPIQGFSVITVDWDPDFKHHLYRGELKVTSKHPKQLIPQPGIYHIQKMDYFFILSSVTKEYIKRRYGIERDLDTDDEQYPEINSAIGAGKQNTEGEKVTEIVCWYKDEDGDIGKFVWTNDTVLEDLPKFYYRRLERCVKCGQVKTDDVCQQCGSKRFKEQVEEVETIDRDIPLADGTVIPTGTQVPFFMPTRYPVVIRKNVPKNFAFEGQSDVDTIRDQQDSIKKVGSKMEEKVLKGGVLVIVPEEVKTEITNETYQVIRANAAQAQMIHTKELTAPIDKDMAYIEQQRQVTQWMLGITNSFQGQEDTSAKSGVAKQIQVQQASGRMRSKEFQKQAAFKELFEIMFEFKLAFYDELRPYLAKGPDGNDLFGEFDKYQFLLRDAAGEYFYNTDFMFSADAGAGIPKDPIFQYNQAKESLASGAIDKLQYWMIMETLNFPLASEIKSQIEEQMKAEQEAARMQQQQAQEQEMINQEQQAQAEAQAQEVQAQGQPHPFDQLLAQLPKHEQDAFRKMEPEQQKAIMEQMMAGVEN
jgi:predicted  nucleic acid-binding Zn-ribbon protein